MCEAKLEDQFWDSINKYGKQAFNESQQIKILNFILEDAKSKLAQDSDIAQLIAEYQHELVNKENLIDAISNMNKFVIALEALDHKGLTVGYLKKQGFYRILYRNPQIKGQELPSNDVIHKFLRMGFIGVAISALIVILFSATAFFTVPFWLTAITTGLFVGASTYLSGILYGVVNDLFATHANLPYFLLGHQPQQTSLLRTNDKVAQGIAWGVAATFLLVTIAAVLFTLTATVAAFFVPMATFLMPVMMIAMPLIAVGAEFYARKRARNYMFASLDFKDERYFNSYQIKGLDYMCPTQTERAAWLANSDRNVFGFFRVPFIGLGALVGLVVLSAINMFLPPLLFASPIIAIAIPAGFAALASVSLLVSGIYMYVNRNKQVDDRYRLEFDRAQIEPNLYLDEDMDYVQGLMNTYMQQASDDATYSSVNTASKNALFDRTRNNTGETVVSMPENSLDEKRSLTM